MEAESLGVYLALGPHTGTRGRPGLFLPGLFCGKHVTRGAREAGLSSGRSPRRLHATLVRAWCGTRTTVHSPAVHSPSVSSH